MTDADWIGPDFYITSAFPLKPGDRTGHLLGILGTVSSVLDSYIMVYTETGMNLRIDAEQLRAVQAQIRKAKGN